METEQTRPHFYEERSQWRQEAADLIAGLVHPTIISPPAPPASSVGLNAHAPVPPQNDRQKTDNSVTAAPDYMATIPSPLKKHLPPRNSTPNTSHASTSIQPSSSHTNHSHNKTKPSQSHPSRSRPSTSNRGEHSGSILSSKMADELQRQEQDREWMERKEKEQKRMKTRFSNLDPCKINPHKVVIFNGRYFVSIG